MPLPFLVFGGITRWRVSAGRYGKNGARMAITATCLDDERIVTFYDGREAATCSALLNGFSVTCGSFEHRLCVEMVKKRQAIFV
jgi:hypothetical protein